MPVKVSKRDKYKSVIVTWVDSGLMRARDEWTPAAQLTIKAEIGVCHTYGALLHVFPESILVGLSYDPDNEQWYSVQEIQRTAITEIAYQRTRKTLTKEELPEVLDKEVEFVV